MKIHMSGILPNTELRDAMRAACAAVNRANASAIVLDTDEGEIAAMPGEVRIVNVRGAAGYRPVVDIVVRQEPRVAGGDSASEYTIYEKHPAVDDLLAGVEFVVTSKDAT